MSEMNNQKKSQIFKIVLICIILGFVGVIGMIKLKGNHAIELHPQGHRGFPVLGSVTSAMANSWQMSLRSMYLNKELRLEDLEKIDFSRPGDPDFGNDPDNEFFNPKGRFGSYLFNYPDQNALDEITEEKGTRIIFNLRRQQLDDGRITDVLYAIIPNINQKQLSLYDEFKLDYPLEIKNDNHSIVIDPERLDLNKLGLVQTMDGKAYVFISIFWRIKSKGANSWQTY